MLFYSQLGWIVNTKYRFSLFRFIVGCISINQTIFERNLTNRNRNVCTTTTTSTTSTTGSCNNHQITTDTNGQKIQKKTHTKNSPWWTAPVMGQWKRQKSSTRTTITMRMIARAATSISVRKRMGYDRWKENCVPI